MACGAVQFGCSCELLKQVRGLQHAVLVPTTTQTGSVTFSCRQHTEWHARCVSYLGLRSC